MSYTPKSLGHLVMRVRDIDRSVDFYTRVMGLTVMERSPSGTVFMSANTEKSHELAIRAIGMDAAGPDHSIIGQAHMAWQMETFEDLQELYDRLIENDVRIVRPGDHGISMGVYFLDPDDNEIEVYYELPKEQWERHPRKGPVRKRVPAQAGRTRRRSRRLGRAVAVCGKRLRTCWTPSPSAPGFSAPAAGAILTSGSCGRGKPSGSGARSPCWPPRNCRMTPVSSALAASARPPSASRRCATSSPTTPFAPSRTSPARRPRRSYPTKSAAATRWSR